MYRRSYLQGDVWLKTVLADDLLLVFCSVITLNRLDQSSKRNVFTSSDHCDELTGENLACRSKHDKEPLDFAIGLKPIHVSQLNDFGHWWKVWRAIRWPLSLIHHWQDHKHKTRIKRQRFDKMGTLEPYPNQQPARILVWLFWWPKVNLCSIS
jgi:hypothetical protein